MGVVGDSEGKVALDGNEAPGSGVEEGEVARELADELRLVSEWLGLGGVKVGRKGDLATALRRAVGELGG